MSDEKPVEDDLQRFQRYMADREYGHACPVCRTDIWHLMEGPGLRPALIYLTKEGQLYPRPSYLSVYTVSCANCGFIEHYSRQTVDDFLAKGGGDVPKDGST
jgi:hypothetical protein